MSLARLVHIMSSLYSSERGKTVQNPGRKGCELACTGLQVSSRTVCWRRAVFPPKNETEEKKPGTLTQREGKTKGRAVLLPLTEYAGQTGVMGTHWAGAVGQGSLELWGCRALGGCHPAQHSTAVLRKEKRDLAIDSGLWETPRSYPALAPSLTFSGSTISTFPALGSCPAAPSESYKKQNCPCKMSKTLLSPSLAQTLCTAPV